MQRSRSPAVANTGCLPCPSRGRPHLTRISAGDDVVTDRVGNLDPWVVLEVSRDTNDAYACGFPYERVLS